MKKLFDRSFGWGMDQLICTFLALLHQRHARGINAREVVEGYVTACERQSRAEHFAVPPAMENFQMDGAGVISWDSPALSTGRFPVNGRAQATVFVVRPEAPTVIMLHA